MHAVHVPRGRARTKQCSQADRYGDRVFLSCLLDSAALLSDDADKRAGGRETTVADAVYIKQISLSLSLSLSQPYPVNIMDSINNFLKVGTEVIDPC